MLLCSGIIAQGKNVKHKTDDHFLIPGYALELQGTYDYNYYENTRGEYVKHGNFSITGTKSLEIKRKGKLTETYSASGKFTDGWLDGLLTIKRSLKHSSGEFQEWTLTANFKNGLPHGEWKTLYKDPGTNNTYAICHFNEGAMVGEVDFNWWKGNNGDFTSSLKKSMKGFIDEHGDYHGKWTLEETAQSADLEFEHGVLYRYVRRNKDGEVMNLEKQDPELIQKAKELAVKYAKGEIDSAYLVQQGCKISKEDNLKAEDVLDFIAYGKKVFARQIIGGQKNLPEPDQEYKYLVPNSYIYIEALAAIPDDIFIFLTNTWKKQLESLREKGSFIYDDTERNTLTAIGIAVSGPLLRIKYKDGKQLLDYRQSYNSYIANNGKFPDQYIPEIKLIEPLGEIRPGDSFFKIKQRGKYYAIGYQKDTMNLYIAKFIQTSWDYILAKYASKYYSVELDTTKIQTSNYHYLLGAIKKANT